MRAGSAENRLLGAQVLHKALHECFQLTKHLQHDMVVRGLPFARRGFLQGLLLRYCESEMRQGAGCQADHRLSGYQVLAGTLSEPQDSYPYQPPLVELGLLWRLSHLGAIRGRPIMPPPSQLTAA